MRVLLTGASSFSGLWLARALVAAGGAVTAVARGHPGGYEPLRRLRIEQVARLATTRFDAPFGSPAFLELIDSAEPFDVLCLHHAEVGDFRRPDYDALAVARANTAGIEPVLERLCRRGLRRVVLTGSVFEADEGDGDRPLEAIGAYGLAKTLTANVVRHAAAAAGVELLKVTLPSPFGAFQAGGLADQLLRAWQAGEVPGLRHPERVRDFVPIDLLATHHAALALGQIPPMAGGRANPSGHVLSCAAFAERLAREMRPRLGTACRFAMASQPVADGEPHSRFNTEPLPALFDRAAQARSWDRLALHYRARARGWMEQAA
ncbi:MAG: NAD-dependent epimerase/dehydratase family protein [Geminicoccaceae bacterium]